MTVEFANEPRGRTGKAGQRLFTWFTETSTYFKELPHGDWSRRERREGDR